MAAPEPKGAHQKTAVKIFKDLSYRHNRGTAWSDFVTMAACSLSLNEGNYSRLSGGKTEGGEINAV